MLLCNILVQSFHGEFGDAIYMKSLKFSLYHSLHGSLSPRSFCAPNIETWSIIIYVMPFPRAPTSACCSPAQQCTWCHHACFAKEINRCLREINAIAARSIILWGLEADHCSTHIWRSSSVTRSRLILDSIMWSPPSQKSLKDSRAVNELLPPIPVGPISQTAPYMRDPIERWTQNKPSAF